MVTLRPITMGNVWDIYALKADKKLVASNAESLAEAYAFLDEFGPDLLLVRGIYKDELAVGFLMVDLGTSEMFDNNGEPYFVLWRLCADLAKIALDKEYEMPSKSAEFALSKELLDSYVGFYGEEGDGLEIKRDEDELYFVIDGQFNFPIYPISEDTFHQKWIDERYTVVRDEEGNLSIWGCKKN